MPSIPGPWVLLIECNIQRQYNEQHRNMSLISQCDIIRMHQDIREVEVYNILLVKVHEDHLAKTPAIQLLLQALISSHV